MAGRMSGGLSRFGIDLLVNLWAAFAATEMIRHTVTYPTNTSLPRSCHLCPLGRTVPRDLFGRWQRTAGKARSADMHPGRPNEGSSAAILCADLGEFAKSADCFDSPRLTLHYFILRASFLKFIYDSAQNILRARITSARIRLLQGR